MNGASSNPFELPEDEVHVWAAHLSDDSAASARFIDILDQEEQARAARFAFEADRTRFIQSHGILRQILAGYMGADAKQVVFTRNEHGKPRLHAASAGTDIHFSLSHSGDRSLVALRRGHAVGVDVEQLRSFPSALDIARRWFTPAQYQRLAGLDAAELMDAFFVLWTHKEAMIKALGTTLAASLGERQFDLERAGPERVVSSNGDGPNARNWFTMRLDPAPGYVAAVASLHPFPPPVLRSWKR